MKKEKTRDKFAKPLKRICLNTEQYDIHKHGAP